LRDKGLRGLTAIHLIRLADVRSIIAAGVKIAFNTDAGVYPHGDNAKQFHSMVTFRMTPAGAIRAATSSAADLIGRSADEGTLEVGKYADLIAVTSSPLEKVETLEHVGLVLKGGKVYKDELGADMP
jgi:imidazolonepropionase-like amidohydrolase